MLIPSCNINLIIIFSLSNPLLFFVFVLIATLLKVVVLNKIKLVIQILILMKIRKRKPYNCYESV